MRDTSSGTPGDRITDHHCLSAYSSLGTPTAFLSLEPSSFSIENMNTKLSMPSTPSIAKPNRIVEDYLEVCPSEDIIGGTINLPEPRVLISNARQLKKNPSEPSRVLSIFNEAVSVSVLYGSRACPSSVWLDLTDAITSIAYTMTVSDITELLKLLATALHRCGRRLNPHAICLSALADGARAAFKSRLHSTEELLEFQSAVADVLRVVALGGGAGTRSLERKEWGQALATKLVPLLAVGTAAVYATYKTLSAEFSPEDGENNVQNALFFAEALVTMPWCPTTTVATEILEASSFSKNRKGKSSSSNRRISSSAGGEGGWKKFLCFIPSKTVSLTNSSTASTTTRTPTSTVGGGLPNYSQLLSKITFRSVAIAQWLEETLAPAALHSMTLQQLDLFTAALVTAAGDDEKINASSSSGKIMASKSSKYDVDSASESNGHTTMEKEPTYPSKPTTTIFSSDKKSTLIRDILVQCAGDAIEEAATRVINAGSCYSSSTCGAASNTTASSSNGDSPPTTPSAAALASHRLVRGGGGSGSGNYYNADFTFATHSPPRPSTNTTTSVNDEVDVCSARRMAATARRNYEAAASVHSPKAADVANFVRVLENYVAAREDEEDAAVQAEIAAAAARLELNQG